MTAAPRISVEALIELVDELRSTVRSLTGQVSWLRRQVTRPGRHRSTHVQPTASLVINPRPDCCAMPDLCVASDCQAERHGPAGSLNCISYEGDVSFESIGFTDHKYQELRTENQDVDRYVFDKSLTSPVAAPKFAVTFDKGNTPRRLLLDLAIPSNAYAMTTLARCRSEDKHIRRLLFFSRLAKAARRHRTERKSHRSQHNPSWVREYNQLQLNGLVAATDFGHYGSKDKYIDQVVRPRLDYIYQHDDPDQFPFAYCYAHLVHPLDRRRFFFSADGAFRSNLGTVTPAVAHELGSARPSPALLRLYIQPDGNLHLSNSHQLPYSFVPVWPPHFLPALCHWFTQQPNNVSKKAAFSLFRLAQDIAHRCHLYSHDLYLGTQPSDGRGQRETQLHVADASAPTNMQLQVVGSFNV